MSLGEKIDLHLHTRYSDSSYDPRELVRLAKELRVTTIAVTDHDTVAGVDEALDEGRRIGVRVIPGVELSTLYQHEHEAHLLGLFIEARHAELAAALDRAAAGRVRRAERILGLLGNLGVDLSIDDVRRHDPEAVVGRMQIAEALVRAKHASSILDAFARYLGIGRPGYVPTITASAAECCGLIRAAGGVAVLAHPGEQIDEQKVAWAVKAGCRALEAYYPTYSRPVTETWVKLAQKLDLGVSGGSDCHGRRKSRVTIGTVSLPPECLADLERRRDL
jgi:3',5'-nucleoside bisphosphate phosphatase